MKAWRLHGFGDYRLDDVAEPEPGPGWVKAKIRVAQPSITEALLLHGHQTYLFETIRATLARGPAQLFGHEFAAEVVATGDGVSGVRVGDRVAPRGSHPDGYVGFDYPGAFAEYGVFPESLFAVLPDRVSDSEGAAIQPLTDAVAGVAAANLGPRDTVAVIGQGAMGLACLQAARAFGARRTIAIARREATLAVSRSLGADDTVDASRDDPVTAVKALTQGRGADVVFETAGGPVAQGLAGDATLHQAAHMAADGGRIVGMAFHGDAAVLPYALFRPRGLRFCFPTMLTRALFEKTVALVASRDIQLKPLITCTLDGIERVPEAFALTADKARHGLINPAQVRIA